MTFLLNIKELKQRGIDAFSLAVKFYMGLRRLVKEAVPKYGKTRDKSLVGKKSDQYNMLDLSTTY
jgi:hypothetical protein